VYEHICPLKLNESDILPLASCVPSGVSRKWPLEDRLSLKVELPLVTDRLYVLLPTRLVLPEGVVVVLNCPEKLSQMVMVPEL
jgi:hypothetical protein